MTFTPGQILEHKEIPEKRRAQVIALSGDKIHLLFETAGGGELLRFRYPNEGLTLSANQSPEGFPKRVLSKPNAKKSTSNKPKTSKSPNAWPFEEALKRFQTQYPAGFLDPQYIADERDYKLAAAQRCKEVFSPEGIAKLRASQDPLEASKAFEKANQGLNLLHTIEWIQFNKALKTSPAALQLAEAYATAIPKGALSEEDFNHLLKSLDQIAPGQKKWTLLTLWPYLASSKGFPFIKPTATRAAADGMNFSINYDAKPNYLTYQRVVALYERLWELLEPLGARDWVDLQSFIWVGWR